LFQSYQVTFFEDDSKNAMSNTLIDNNRRNLKKPFLVASLFCSIIY